MSSMSLEQQAFQMDVNGFCILEKVIPTAPCYEIRNRIIEAVEREHLNYETGRMASRNRVGFTPSIINHDQSFAAYLADSRVLAIVGRLLGENIRISFTSAIINYPGNERGGWHADWPFNQNNAGHLASPYPDTVMHVTTLWMLSPFERENGGTLIMPGSHRRSTNPTAVGGPDPLSVFPAEINITGSAGSVLVMDSRTWHATAANLDNEPRVALAVRYAPWWLNLEVLRPGSEDRQRMLDATGKTDNTVPSIRRDVWENLPSTVQTLYEHWSEPLSISESRVAGGTSD